MPETSSALTTRLLNIKDYSDLVFRCDEQVFNVHKAIVCGQSSVIAAALKGDFMEAKTGVLDVSFDVDSVRRLVEFMYTGDYQESLNPALDILSSGVPEGTRRLSEDIEIEDEGGSTTELELGVRVLEPLKTISDRLICHGRMNSIADYYDISALASLSNSKVKEILSKKWSVESFSDLLRESLNSTSDKNFLRMLGSEAADHIYELFDGHYLDEGSLAEAITPYALPKCILRMKVVELHKTELESSLSSEIEASERKSRDYASHYIDKCNQLLRKKKKCQSSACTAEFNCYFQKVTRKSTDELIYIMCCGSCATTQGSTYGHNWREMLQRP